MTKTYTKTFEHKGQMINYYKKMTTNNRQKFSSIFYGYDAELKSFFIMYSYS